MSVLGQACRDTDTRDLLCMMLVEKLRHDGTPATATAGAAQIKGAPIVAVDEVLTRLVKHVGVLDFVIMQSDLVVGMAKTYAVNPLGAEVLHAEVEGWAPSPMEQGRRDALLASAQAGRLRS